MATPPATAPSPVSRLSGRTSPGVAATGSTGSTGSAAPILLDDVSKAIIEQLQQDGRRPYATIAKAVGLSEAAVRQRVQRLLDAKVMEIVAVTDPTTLGFLRWAMVGMRVEGDLQVVVDQLSALPEVDYVVITAGSFDLFAEVVCEDDAHLLRLLNDHIRSIPQIQHSETFVYLRLAKQTYSWGTR